MKYFGKLAVLGAALAVSATSAFATPITGSVNTDSTSVATNLATTQTSLTFTAVPQVNTLVAYNTGIGNTPCTDGKSNLCDIATGTITLFSFSTSSLSNTEIIAIAATATTDAFEFDASGFYALTTSGSDQGSVILTGILKDVSASPKFDNDPNATVTFAENGGGNNFNEDIIANTPEPSSLMLLGTGLIGGAGVLMRRRRLTA